MVASAMRTSGTFEAAPLPGPELDWVVTAMGDTSCIVDDGGGHFLLLGDNPSEAEASVVAVVVAEAAAAPGTLVLARNLTPVSRTLVVLKRRTDPSRGGATATYPLRADT
jgi:hypothetical protein